MTHRFTRIQIAELLEIDEGFVIELERAEIIGPVEGDRFDAIAVERVRVAWSMYDCLGVNVPGLEVALHLLDRWQGERRRVLELLERLRDDDAG